jgi:hypothetical protein
MLRPHSTTCYGTLFLPGSMDTCLSWSADSSLRYYYYLAIFVHSNFQSITRILVANISLWRYSPSEQGTDVTMISTSMVKDMSILSCCLEPSTNRIICGGGNTGSASSGHAFLGTPIRLLSCPASFSL